MTNRPDRSGWTAEKPSDLVALDVETYYDGDTSLKELSNWQYVWHPKTFPYLISFKSEDFRWVGDPRDFKEWERLHGKTLLAHNGTFDFLCLRRMYAEGVVPASVVPRREVCTADLMGYLRVYRSLAYSVLCLYDQKLVKEVRDRAKGKTGEQIKAEGWWDEMVAYGGLDSDWCWKLACDHLKDWPATDQAFSELNRTASWRGIDIDVDALRKDGGALDILADEVHRCLKAIPWYPKDKPLGVKSMRIEARRIGIKVPASLSKNNAAALEFFAKHGPSVPWVWAVRDYRPANTFSKKIENLDKGTREDGTFPYTSVYCGANTGRFTASVRRVAEIENEDDGGNKFNILNMPRKPLKFGSSEDPRIVDVRGLIVAPKGYKLFIGDYGQVEARLALFYAGDWGVLDKIKAGYHIYEAMAEKLFSVENPKGLKDRDPATYRMTKTLVLSGNFGAGGKRFFTQAPILTADEDHPERVYRPTLEEAFEKIKRYRDIVPLVVAQWRRHQTALLNSVYQKDPTHRVELASGRWITYYAPHAILAKDPETGKTKTEFMVTQIRGCPPARIYGAKIFENICQSTSYDILRDAAISIEDNLPPGDAIYKFSLYDELVYAVKEDRAREIGAEIARLMVSSSPWLDGCPLDVDWKIVDRYTK